MARTVDYNLKGEKIKSQIDEIIKELLESKKAVKVVVSKPSIKDFDFEELDIKTLQQLQLKISKLIIEKSEQGKE